MIIVSGVFFCAYDDILTCNKCQQFASFEPFI
jgi:hypothetical protein